MSCVSGAQLRFVPATESGRLVDTHFKKERARRQQRDPDMPQPRVSIDDAARVLRFCRHTIIKWVKAGVIPSVKLGSRRLIAFAELERIATEG